jgi:hypothetical protein
MSDHLIVRNQLSRGQIAKVHQSELRNRPPVPPKSPRHSLDGEDLRFTPGGQSKQRQNRSDGSQGQYRTQEELVPTGAEEEEATKLVMPLQNEFVNPYGIVPPSILNGPKLKAQATPNTDRPLPPIPPALTIGETDHKLKRKAVPGAVGKAKVSTQDIVDGEFLRTPSPCPEEYFSLLGLNTPDADSLVRLPVCKRAK